MELRSRVISIAGAKGSPGCSVLAIALSRCFVASGIPTLLVDADAEGGGLAALLDVQPLGQSGVIDRSATDLYGTQIEALLWFAELGRGASDDWNGLELAAAARARYPGVVIDLGHSSMPLQRQLSASSDWLLWVVVPDRSGLERADRALASGELKAAGAGLVLNRIGMRCLDRADEVLSSRHGMPVMARIKDDRRLPERLLGKQPARHAWGVQRTLRDLARSVHPDVGSVAPAWP